MDDVLARAAEGLGWLREFLEPAYRAASAREDSQAQEKEERFRRFDNKHGAQPFVNTFGGGRGSDACYIVMIRNKRVTEFSLHL